jgi:hypothetical protein
VPLLVLLVAVPLTAQTPDPAEALGHAPWPGMSAWDMVWCRDLVAMAQFVEIREPGHPTRVVWVKDVRGWLKPNGFYGLKLNGEPVDETLVWISYAGATVNLRVLFTYGSAPIEGVSEFRDAPPR